MKNTSLFTIIGTIFLSAIILLSTNAFGFTPVQNYPSVPHTQSSIQGLDKPEDILITCFTSQGYFSIPPREKGLIGRPGKGGYIGYGRTQCVGTSIMNANLKQIFDKNPRLSEAEKKALADDFIKHFNDCVDKVNSDNDKSNDIDLTDGVTPHKSRKGKFSTEFESVMKCKNQALNDLKRDQQSKPKPKRLKIPVKEIPKVIYKYSPEAGKVYVGRGNWCKELKKLYEQGQSAIITIVGRKGGHALTILGVNCATNPPTIQVQNPSQGDISTLNVNEDPSTGSLSVTPTDPSVGLGIGNENPTVISIIAVGPQTPLP